MVKTGKNYTNSELFTLANKIRRETGCTKSEAYQQAKTKLENKVKIVNSHSKVNRIEITDRVKPWVREKYHIQPGEVYTSVKELASHMNTTLQNVYGYIKVGYFKNVN